MATYHGYGIEDLTLVTKEDRSTVQGVAWVREEPWCYDTVAQENGAMIHYLELI